MEDTRVIESQLSASIPPHANMKMYTTKSSPGEFYEAFIGFKSDKQFAAGVYQQTPNARNTIADFNIALNSSRLLFVKADWEAENVQSALVRIKYNIF